jgi:hypothetical protein
VVTWIVLRKENSVIADTILLRTSMSIRVFIIRNLSIDDTCKMLPVAVAERSRASRAWAVFDRSEAVITGSNPALGMDV